MSLMPEVAKRFWLKVEPVKLESSACWNWIASRRGIMKYGSFWFDNFNQNAHRVSWSLHCGPIPEGLWVLHHCDNPQCVRPSHLFIGNHTDNMHDCHEKGRNSFYQKYGLRNHCSKGHPYEPSTLYIDPIGGRVCKICRRITEKRKRERRKHALQPKEPHQVELAEPPQEGNMVVGLKKEAKNES